MKVLILGMNPSNKNGGSKSMSTLYDWTDRLGLKTFSFCNINHEQGKFSPEKIQRDYVKTICKDYDKVIALGNVASVTLQNLGVNHYKLPHPSGLNRQLNDPEAVNAKLIMCQRYLRNEVLQ